MRVLESARESVRSGSDSHSIRSSSDCLASSDEEDAQDDDEGDERQLDTGKVSATYFLILLGFLAVQFGHGSNIGVAVSLPGDSKAMNLSLGSWVMIGVTIGLPVTPLASRTFGGYRLCAACVVIDILVILLMLIPRISLYGIYFVRFLVGFFEAPLLPYLQEWLAVFAQANWNVWNTVLHAMVPLGENCGYLGTQMMVDAGINWQWAFLAQAVVLILVLLICYAVGGRQYLDISLYGRQEERKPFNASNGDNAEETITHTHGPQYPATENWTLYWVTNVAFACQLGFLTGTKFVMRDYALALGFPLESSLAMFSGIALVGPALGGTLAMSGGIVHPDQWSEHSRTLLWLTIASGCAAVLAWCLLFVSEGLFWPMLFACFTAAGCIYPAAQGIVNIALTKHRVTEASVYQVQCNNLLFAMPLPYFIGKSMDVFNIDVTFRFVMSLQTLAFVGFFIAWSYSVLEARARSNGISFNGDEDECFIQNGGKGDQYSNCAAE